jgi:CHRD domain
MVTVLFGCAGMGGDGGIKVTLSGAQEVPPVTTNATGSGTIVIWADKSVSGSVTTSGVAGIAAHIHMGAVGKNGPVIVPMTKTSDNEWTIQAGAKLTDEQYASFKAGDLYVNVHSAANKGGEIRGQLKP